MIDGPSDDADFVQSSDSSCSRIGDKFGKLWVMLSEWNVVNFLLTYWIAIKGQDLIMCISVSVG